MQIHIHARRKRNLGSKLIMFFTGETISHVGVSFGEEPTIYHAESMGCNTSTFKEFERDAVAVTFHTFTVPKETYLTMRNRAISKLGSKYDFLGILFFSLFLIVRKLGWRIPLIPVNPKWLFCSEYVEYIVFGKTSLLTPLEVISLCMQIYPK